jgi:hypothetical protein
MSEDIFALKGGTAINFFWRDYPRKSVDIDLAYVNVKDRKSTLKDIHDHLFKIDDKIKRIYPDAHIQQNRDNE